MTTYRSGALAIAAVMESPSISAIALSAPESWVSPSQQRLLDRNTVMLDSMMAALQCASDEGVIVASTTIWRARRFLHLLPAVIPAADAYISGEESICFDWDEEPKNQLSIMVQKSGRLAFSAYFEGDKLNGSVSFNAANLPQEIGAVLDRWYRASQAR